MKWKTILFIVIVIIAGCFYWLFSAQKERTFNQEADANYFLKHQINFSGTINNKIVWDHQWGILCLNVSSISAKSYNPFKLGEKYFFYYLNGPYAEIYTGGLSLFNLGDSLVVNSKVDSMYIYREHVKIDTWPLTISTSDFYYDWLRKTHVDK